MTSYGKSLREWRSNKRMNDWATNKESGGNSDGGFYRGKAVARARVDVVTDAVTSMCKLVTG